MLMPANQPLSALENAAEFVARHIGIEPIDEAKMLSAIGAASRRALIEAVADQAREAHAQRLYWNTQEHNATARLLYDKVAQFRGFIRYDYPL